MVGDHASSRGSSIPALSSVDRLAEHLLIQLVADFLDMARLFLAQQIAGAANIEIVAGELEAGAERVERLQHVETLLRLRRDGSVRGRREQRVGAYLAAPDAPAQLIELRQAEHIGAPDDERIGGRNVEAEFDDASSTAECRICHRRRRPSSLRVRSRAIWPWAMTNFASGAFSRRKALASSRSSMRGQTKNAWPPR